MDNSNRKSFLINFAYYACWLVIIYVGFEYLLPIFLPFILAYMLSALSHKITKNQSTLMLVLIYIVLGFLLVLIIMSIVSGLAAFITRVPSIYKNNIEPYFLELYYRLDALIEKLNIDFLKDSLESILNILKDGVGTILNKTVSLLSSVVFSIPSILFSIVIFIIASFYFTADYDKVQQRINRYFPSLQSFTSEKLSQIATAYGKIMCMTFVEVSIGLLILGFKYPLLIGAITAVVDILPVLGSGTVLIPWGIFEIVIGNWKGVGLLVLYIIITIVRQYIEPRFVGKELDIPPLLSLMSMVIGLRLFGFAGMLGFPLMVSFYQYKRTNDILNNDTENAS